MIATQPHAAANPGRPPRHRPPCHRPPQASPLATAAAGFTLIEVLISIIILALGLLGIGVVFPVVIRQQRISTDEVAGILMARNVSAKLLNRTEEYVAPAASGLGEQTVWYWWRQHLAADWDAYKAGTWGVAKCADDGTMELAPENPPAGLFPTSAIITYSADMPSSPPDPEQAYSRVEWPYVWDLAVQPVYNGDTDISNDSMRIAVFVRRIDSRTRQDLPPPDSSPDPLPVAIERDTHLPAVDRRAGQSGLEYAQPVVMQARIQTLPSGGVDRDHLTWNGVTISEENWAIVSQVGQKIVDSFGNVYTVQRGSIDENGYKRVRITPPIPASITEAMVARMRMSIITTPQPAVAVYTFEVTP